MNRCIVFNWSMKTANKRRAIQTNNAENEHRTDYSPARRGANVRKPASTRTLVFVLLAVVSVRKELRLSTTRPVPAVRDHLRIAR